MGQPADDVLISTRHGAVLWLELNRPAVLNALNGRLFSELARALALAHTDGAVHAVVLVGAGERAFCAGADLDELAGLSAHAAHGLLSRGQDIMRAVERLGKPVIAAVNGHAVGGGFELALAAHLIVASETARFSLPEAGLGLIPGYGGTQRLPRHIGRSAAYATMLAGEVIDAETAFHRGLTVTAPVAPHVLRQSAGRWADRIATRSPSAVRMILEATAGHDPDDGGLAHETALATVATVSADAAEGISAFQAKRPPMFAES